ncbi:MAG TPA: hypothetical protein VGF88_07835 [Acidobacteriaceae bacterium]|jgi:hypothetical protein
MEEMQTTSPVLKIVAPILAAVAIGGAGLGYAVHEHQAAERLAAQNQQMSTELASTRSQMNDLTAKVSELAARSDVQAAQPPAPAPTVATPASHPAGKPRAGRVPDRRLTKMQAQLDAQGKAIEATRGDLASTRTELTGSIAKTHDELVVLQKKGERSYFEFDIQKSKAFTHEGPVGVSLRKANLKHQYADLELMVEDRDLVQKHVNLDQPVMFYQPDTELPIQVVINDITKDHIHGYVSAPKYRKSELASTANPDDGIVGDPAQATNADGQTAARKKLTVPPQD